jgi:MFS superfamily sulfate permease-like transporter
LQKKKGIDNIVPKSGLKGLVENWQSDLIAAVSVALVALPLALGIAFASDVPPMAGVISAAIGGIVTTFFRGSHVAINGPAAVL